MVGEFFILTGMDVIQAEIVNAVHAKVGVDALLMLKNGVQFMGEG